MNEPIKKETPVERLMRQCQEQSSENLLAKAKINITYSAESSDPATITLIEHALASKTPFGLRCQRSRVIFIPDTLKAYWVWGDGSTGPTFTYVSFDDMISGVGMQYMVHKEFMSMAEVTAIAKIMLYESAIETLADWRQNVLPQPGEQAR